MSEKGKAPLPFPGQPSVPIVGQPFVVEGVAIPVNARIHCNCGGADVTVVIHHSVPALCQSCQRLFFAAFNPITKQLEIGMRPPEAP